MGVKRYFFKCANRLLPGSFRKQMNNFYILAVKYGQFRTIRRWKCVDGESKKIPWYTYPAIEYLNNIDFGTKVVFEYGSGNSSSYWAKKSKSTFSVEHNKEWYEKINNELEENQNIILCEDEKKYLESIKNISSKIDVIIIDGVYRDKCARLVNTYLSNDGIVILDNSDWHKETARYLREELDLIEVDFHGFGPINSYTWTTSIFFTRNTRLHPVKNVQPHNSMAAGKNYGNENFN